MCAVLWASDNTRSCCGGVEISAYVAATCEPAEAPPRQMRDCELRVAVLRYVETVGPDQGDDQEDDGDGHRSAASECQT